MAENAALEALRRIQKQRAEVSIEVGGETLVLKRPRAVRYQKILSMATELEGKSADQIMDFFAECLCATVPNLGHDEALEVIAQTGGFQSDIVKASMQACGMNELTRLKEDIQDESAGK